MSLALSPPIPSRLYTAILVWPTVFNFWHSGALALSPERQSARMSKIKNGWLDQYGTKPFEQQQFGTSGAEGVNIILLHHSLTLFALRLFQRSTMVHFLWPKPTHRKLKNSTQSNPTNLSCRCIQQMHISPPYNKNATQPNQYISVPAMSRRFNMPNSKCALRHTINPFKPSGVKWLHFKVFRAILVYPTLFNFLTFGHTGAQSWAPCRVPECQKIKRTG